MLPAILLFVVTYVLMLSFGKYRPYIALAAIIPAYIYIRLVYGV